MNSLEYILSKQISCADRNKIKFLGSAINRGREAYTEDIDDNLFEPLLPETEKEISKGDGGELKGSSTKLPKFHALHSSSAIGVNVFQYWKNKNISDLAYLLGLCRKDNKSAKDLNFEQKFKISDNFGFAPNIDVVIENDDQSKIKAFGIECKFSEAYSSYKHPGLKEKYLKEIDEQWNDIKHLHEFAKTISPEDNIFRHLHPAQLVKHILGLKNKFGKNGFRLLYLWYDVFGEDGFQHREEIKRFTEITSKDNIKFHSLTYQELFVRMKKEIYEGNEDYINYFTDRYL
jgi:hypothetical protein